jgi:hypothetical protein
MLAKVRHPREAGGLMSWAASKAVGDVSSPDFSPH